MTCSPSKRLPPCKRVWSVRPISSSTPFPLSKAVSASPTPPRFTRLKKTLATPRVDHAPRHAVGAGLESASQGAESEPEKSHALLWPPVPSQGKVFVKV